VRINAIYEKNIETFLTKMGANKEFCEQKEQEQKDYYKAQELKYEQERKESKAKRDKQLKEVDLSALDKFKRIEKTNEPGTYIQRAFDRNDNLIFRVVYIYLPEGKKKPRWNKTEFNTLQEALDYKPKESTWGDSIFNGRITGWRIDKEPEKPLKEPAKQIDNVEIIHYSDKAIAVIGDTKPIKDTLKNLGGKFNFRLTCGAGWIFPSTKLEAVKSKLNI